MTMQMSDRHLRPARAWRNVYAPLCTSITAYSSTQGEHDRPCKLRKTKNATFG